MAYVFLPSPGFRGDLLHSNENTRNKIKKKVFSAYEKKAISFCNRFVRDYIGRNE